MTVDAPNRPAQPAVSPWIRAAAYAVPLCVLPSATWRMSVVIQGLPEACPRTMGSIEPYYVASLSLVSFGAALLTIGLVRRWGEVVPAWLPVIGGWKVVLAYAPLAAWPPLLLVVTIAYYRRRTSVTSD